MAFIFTRIRHRWLAAISATRFFQPGSLDGAVDPTIPSLPLQQTDVAPSPPPAMAELGFADHGSAVAVDATFVTSGSFTPPNDSLLVVVGFRSHWGGLTPILSVSGGGLTWTEQLVGITPNGDYHEIVFWTAPVVTGASMTVTVTSSLGDIYALAGCFYSYTGYDTADPVGAASVGYNTEGSYSGALTFNMPTAPDVSSEILAAMAGDLAWTIAPDTGWTEVDDFIDANTRMQSQTQRRTDSTSAAVSWADATGSWRTMAAAIEIKAAALTAPSGQPAAQLIGL